jgi:hypothetical protein
MVKTTKISNRVDDKTFVTAIQSMFRNIKSGNTLYLAFTRKGFYMLIFVMAMSIIANLILVDLLITAPTVVQRSDLLTVAVQLILSISAIVAGLWLFLKGVNIVTEK